MNDTWMQTYSGRGDTQSSIRAGARCTENGGGVGRDYRAAVAGARAFMLASANAHSSASSAIRLSVGR
jgi:hypothetical protein